MRVHISLISPSNRAMVRFNVSRLQNSVRAEGKKNRAGMVYFCSHHTRLFPMVSAMSETPRPRSQCFTQNRRPRSPQDSFVLLR
jgi:hypothetical protein